MTDLQTSETVSMGSSTSEKVPSKVMSTAITPINATDHLLYTWKATNVTDEFFMFIYIAEIETLKKNDIREFNIYLNGDYWDGPVSPLDHTATTLFSSFFNSSSYELTIGRTQRSTLRPILNAIEIYNAKQLLQKQTDDQDGRALLFTISMYLLS